MVYVNLGGWVVVGYLMKGYIDRQKETEIKAESALKIANQVHTDNVILKEKINGITAVVERIERKMEENQRDVIRELKTEIQNLRK